MAQQAFYQMCFTSGGELTDVHLRQLYSLCMLKLPKCSSEAKNLIHTMNIVEVIHKVT